MSRSLGEFFGHTGNVFYFEVSPIEKSLADTGVDVVIRIWEMVSSGRTINLELPVHQHQGSSPT
ncbi:MAG: hypothetical protein DWI21_15525 [Planctomycetota bacterium]|nr:MAG: hypothetical protein DWI21_15525 [Planctomycetota bacterium]